MEINDAAPEVIEATKAFIEEDRQNTIDYFAETYGVTRGEEMLDDFSALLTKWVDLLGDADGAEAVEKLYWDEIYSKVDIAQHGIN